MILSIIVYGLDIFQRKYYLDYKLSEAIEWLWILVHSLSQTLNGSYNTHKMTRSCSSGENVSVTSKFIWQR